MQRCVRRVRVRRAVQVSTTGEVGTSGGTNGTRHAHPAVWIHRGTSVRRKSSTSYKKTVKKNMNSCRRRVRALGVRFSTAATQTSSPRARSRHDGTLGGRSPCTPALPPGLDDEAKGPVPSIGSSIKTTASLTAAGWPSSALLRLPVSNHHRKLGQIERRAPAAPPARGLAPAHLNEHYATAVRMRPGLKAMCAGSNRFPLPAPQVPSSRHCGSHPSCTPFRRPSVPAIVWAVLGAISIVLLGDLRDHATEAVALLLVWGAGVLALPRPTASPHRSS